MTMRTPLKSATHRQTRYVAAPMMESPDVLPLPGTCQDLDAAKDDLREYGLCLLEDALTLQEVTRLREELDTQAKAERELGDLAPPETLAAKQLIYNMVNKGKTFLDLLEREETDELAGYLLGKDFLLSSMSGGVFSRPSLNAQQLHRDQGQVPATADFPAACNLFWLLDDFTPERGSTFVVPGSHRWRPEYLVDAPERDKAVQITAKAGTLFVWDGRIWHGTGINREGHPRRHIGTFLCLPWMRQQENWGVTCLQEVLDEASPKLKVRLGLKTYGTLGMTSGTRVKDEQGGLGNYPVTFPEYIIGEKARLHPLRRVSRKDGSDE